jgi:hypothetical protein
MDQNPELEDLVTKMTEKAMARVRPLIEESLREAFAAGAAAAAASVVKVITDAAKNFVPLSAYDNRAIRQVSEPLRGMIRPIGVPQEDADEDDGRPRAPRGRLDEILADVVPKNPGLTVEQLEDLILSIDPRIARKSVYNRLRHHESTTSEYARIDMRWYHRSVFESQVGQGNSPLQLRVNLSQVGQGESAPM